MIKIFGVALLLSLQAQAGIVRWEIQDAALEDGTFLTGYFDFDWARGTYWPGLGFRSGEVLASELHRDGGQSVSHLNIFIGAHAGDPWTKSLSVMSCTPIGYRDEMMGGMFVVTGQDCAISDPPLGSEISFRTEYNHCCLYSNIDDVLHPDEGRQVNFLSGKLVAVAYVPQTSTYAALAIGLMLLAGRSVRSARLE